MSVALVVYNVFFLQLSKCTEELDSLISLSMSILKGQEPSSAMLFGYDRKYTHYVINQEKKECGALESCFGLLSPHQPSIPHFSLIKAPPVIDAVSDPVLVDASVLAIFLIYNAVTRNKCSISILFKNEEYKSIGDKIEMVCDAHL